jgi:hypothetical protein
MTARLGEEKVEPEVKLQYTPLQAVGIDRGAEMSLTGSPYGIRFSHKIYRPPPTEDVT